MALKRMTREVAKNLSVAEQHEWFQQQRSRRAILKGGLRRRSVLGGAALLGPSAGAAVLRAGRSGPHASPYLVSSRYAVQRLGRRPFRPPHRLRRRSDPADEHRLAGGEPGGQPVRADRRPIPSTWGSSIPAAFKNVSTPWADITAFLDSVPPAATAAKAPEEQYYAHAAADFLEPGTTYYYVVGHQGLDPRSSGQLAGADRQLHDRAQPAGAPSPSPPSGTRAITYDAVATTNLILAQSPAFHLHAGDISYAEDGGDGLLTDAYDPRAWDSFFIADRPAPPPTSPGWSRSATTRWSRGTRPTATAPTWTGSTSRATARASVPGRTTSPTATSAFISLDPNDVSYEIPANLGYSGGAQTDLAGSDAGSVPRQSPDRLHRRVLPPLRLLHVHDPRLRRWRPPVLDAAVRPVQVDLVINGHNHIYERTDPIIAGAVTTATRRSAPPSRRPPRGRPTSPVAAPARASTPSARRRQLRGQRRQRGLGRAATSTSRAAPRRTRRLPGPRCVTRDTPWWSSRSTPSAFGPSTMLVRILNEDSTEIDRFTLARQ